MKRTREMVLVDVKRIGNELVVTLSDEASAMLQAKEGDTFVLNKAESGGVELVRPDAAFEERLKRGRKFLKTYRSTFEALAK